MDPFQRTKLESRVQEVTGRGSEARQDYLKQHGAYYSFQPVFHLSRVLGVMPLVRTDRGTGYGRSKFVTFYCMCLLVSLIASNLFTSNALGKISGALLDTDNPVNVSSKKEGDKVTGNTMLNAVNRYVNIICLSLNYLLYAVKLRNLPATLNELRLIDEMDYGNGKLILDVGDISRDCWLFSTAVTFFTVIIVLIPSCYTLSMIAYVENMPWELIPVFAFQDVVKMSAVAGEAQFISLVFMLRQRFRSINIFMSGLHIQGADSVETLRGWKHLYPIISSKVHNDEVFLRPHRRVSQTPQCSRSLAHCLKRLRLCHRRLCDVAEEVVNTYEVQLLLSIANCFMGTVAYMYLVTYAASMTVVQVHSVMAGVLWGIHCGARLVLLSVVPAITTVQAHRSRVLVERIHERNMDITAKEEVLLFISHMTSRQVDFTTCGLFTLNLNFILSIAVAVATYVVILLQFRSIPQ